MSDTNCYSIEFIEEEDHDAVLEFLRKFYFQDAPINKCLQTYPCQEMEDWCSKMIPQRSSFKATAESGRIVGVFLNTRVSATDHFAPNPEECTNQKLKIELSFLDFINLKFDLWQKYPHITRALEAGILSVDPEYRRMGIAKNLTQRTLDYAQQSGFPMVVCHCSSHFTFSICDATGFEEVFRLPYADYVVNGERPIEPEHPHKDFVIAVKVF